MKTTTLLAAVLLGMSLSAPAARYDSGFSNGGLIPDNTITCSDTRTANGLRPVIQSASVMLNLAGGDNSGLCAHLSYEGSKLVLLNEVGVGAGCGRTATSGYSDAGFSNVVLQDAGCAGVIRDDGGRGVPIGTSSVDLGNMSPEDLSTSDATGAYGASQQVWPSPFCGLRAIHLALVGLGVCVAGAGFGLRFYVRAGAEC